MAAAACILLNALISLNLPRYPVAMLSCTVVRGVFSVDSMLSSVDELNEKKDVFAKSCPSTYVSTYTYTDILVTLSTYIRSSRSERSFLPHRLARDHQSPIPQGRAADHQ